MPFFCCGKKNDVIEAGFSGLSSTSTARSMRRPELCNAIDELNTATWDNTIPYVPNIQSGRIIKCYDGDTCTIATKLYNNEPVYRFNLRLARIDAPELKTRNPDEKYAAEFVRDKLNQKILHKYVTIRNIGLDKYGRILCEVYLNGECINDWLLNNKYVVEYEGGKKITPDDWCAFIGIESTKNDE